MPAVPSSHITDSQKLEADGIVDLFELSPNAGGTLYFKADDAITWLGNEYVGLPVKLSEISKNAENVSSMPKLVIGEENIDLSMFKPLIWDGHVDGAILIHKQILLDNLLANLNICEITTYRVKRPENYSRSRIVLQLSTSSNAMNFSIPNQQYYPPDYPSVML